VNSDNHYIGRFAPSPSGPLHFGSLVAAVASFLDARSKNGQWLVRMEDLDPPRESPSAPEVILKQLKDFELVWDGQVLFQSTRLDAYAAALESLQDRHLTFQCRCSRNKTPSVYPGTCRDAAHTENLATLPTSTRLRVDPCEVGFEDRILGRKTWHLQHDVGDFIIRRKDRLFAYQLAVVVDDAYQNITHVVRGSDLLDSTPRQIFLNQCLHLSQPTYAHLPVILGEDGFKLSKQAMARPISNENPSSLLKLALKALGQKVIDSIDYSEMLAVSALNWDIERVPKTLSQNIIELTDEDLQK
jgi:glutamyl-Q tRNA(Asp) synthetase